MITNQDIAARLKVARELIVRGWTTRAMARDELDEPCSATDEIACSWCTWGAIEAASGGGALQELCCSALCRATGCHPNILDDDEPGSLGHWNDAHERTAGEVLHAFNRAIAELEAA